MTPINEHLMAKNLQSNTCLRVNRICLCGTAFDFRWIPICLTGVKLVIYFQAIPAIKTGCQMVDDKIIFRETNNMSCHIIARNQNTHSVQ